MGSTMANQDESKNISRIYQHPIGQPFIVSTDIQDESRIIKINITETTISIPPNKLSDEEIAQRMLDEYENSIMNRNSCACPHFRPTSGANCAIESQFNTTGSNKRRTRNALCYRSDISKSMINAYRKKNNL